MRRRHFLQLPLIYSIEIPRVSCDAKYFVEIFLKKIDKVGRNIGKTRWSYKISPDNVVTYFDVNHQRHVCEASAILFPFEYREWTEETPNFWGFQTVAQARMFFKVPLYVDAGTILHVAKEFEDLYEYRNVFHQYYDNKKLDWLQEEVKSLLGWRSV